MTWASTCFTRALQLRYPIVQAPCAGHTTVDLVAAVSNYGGLGSLGAATMSADTLRQSIRSIREKTCHPFAVNIFCRPDPPVTHTMLQQQYEADKELAAIRAQLHLSEPEQYTLRSPPLDDQIAVILEEKVKIVSFTFGTLPPKLLDQLWEAGVYTIGTATTVNEALFLAGLESGSTRRQAHCIVAQGLQAGGHRGTFLNAPDEQQSTLQLVRSIKEAFAKYPDAIPVPILAAGGLSNGAQVYEALNKAQADGVVLGTLFMLSKDSSTPDAHRRVLLESQEKTKLTRSLTGRFARGYPNAFMNRMETVPDDGIPCYDIHSSKTKDIVTYATQHGMADYMLLWSGSNALDAASFTNQATLSATEVMDKLVQEVNTLDDTK
ncbi:2-nitropropane dioxygenase [Radiomyces spectabilis]|uniref:2-nitropropane dioxygenase n=1 Tax=Radiomyces spectabilis TaxID=64574 RepID=UPI00221E80E2|nr:2-nitropropane dioxygenase [Radiomyces spectabilis]KAI8381192.1 2-nitropropane dioxygenase [Radiomyces spectabilis]